VDLKWASESVMVAKVVVVPLKVMIEPLVSIANKFVAAAFWIWNAVVESAEFLNLNI
jgi:hypothetical protein